MDAVSLLRSQLESAHEWLEGTLGDSSDAELHYAPAGKANPVGATYAHAVATEDMVVNGMLKGAAPLLATTHQGKTGMSEPMPGFGPEWSGYFDWTRSVRLNLPQLRSYAKDVYKNSDDYLASLTPDDLDREIDAMGNKMTLGALISGFVIGHLHDDTGEISAVKGLQGSKGYPEGA